MIDLKPCPFCGRVPTAIEVVYNRYGANRLKIDCCMSFDIWSDELIYSDAKGYVRVGRDAVEKWNTRAGEQDGN